MQFDQPAHLFDVVGRVTQGAHAVARHPGAHELVMVEADRPSRPERAGLGLADVVEERGKANYPAGAGPLHDGDGVGEHVLVAVDRVLFESEGGQLREELLGEPGLHEEPEALRGVVHHEQLVELVPHPLVGDDVEPAPEAANRLDAAAARAGGHNPQ